MALSGTGWSVAHGGVPASTVPATRFRAEQQVSKEEESEGGRGRCQEQAPAKSGSQKERSQDRLGMRGSLYSRWGSLGCGEGAAGMPGVQGTNVGWREDNPTMQK